MKALVYRGPGEKAWEEKPDPALVEPTDAIVRIDAATICGTDLHILKGDVPEVDARHGPRPRGRRHRRRGRLGVTTLAAGDRVLISCITSCGRCRFCREGHYGHCLGGGGWILGHLIDGVQAEYARIPFADTSRLQGARRAHRRAGAVPRRHPADGVRGRRPERRGRRRATSS